MSSTGSSRNLSDIIRRIGRHAFGQFFIADGVLIDIVLIHKVFGDDDVHHPECQRTVRARTDSYMPRRQLRAVLVRTGSITTTFAPFFFASSMKGQ